MPGDVEELRSKWVLDVQGFVDSIRRVKSETSGAKEELDKVGDTGEESMDRIERSGSRMAGVFSRLKLIVAGFFASFSAALAIRQMISLNASLEEINISFETMLGDGARARALLAEVFSFAETTPFRQDDLLAGAKSLLAFGEEAENIVPALRRLGDVSAGLNIPIRDLAELYGKARVQGRLFQEDINQLTGRGIPIIQELAKQFGVTEGAVRELVESGRVGFANLEEAFRAMTSEGGQFAGLTQKLSESFNGLTSTLQDQLAAVLRDLGAGLFTELRNDLKNLVTSLAEVRESEGFKDTIKAISEALAEMIRGLRQAVAFLIEHGATIAKVAAVLVSWRVGLAAVTTAQLAYNVVVGAGAGLLGLFRAAGIAVQGLILLMTGRVTQATVAWQLFNTTVKANPIGLAVAAITAAITAFTLFRDRTDEAADAQERLADRLRDNIDNIRRLTGAGLAQELAKIAEESNTVSARVTALRGALTGTGGLINIDNVIQTRAQAQAELEAGQIRLNQINQEAAEIEAQINGDLEKRLGYLQETVRIITSQAQVTAEDLAQVQKINQEVQEIQDTLDARRGAANSFSVIGVDPAKEAQALERLKETLVEFDRQARLAKAGTGEQAQALRELFEVQKQLDQLTKQSSGVALSQEDQDALDRTLTALEARGLELVKQIELSGRLNESTLETARLFEALIPGALTDGVLEGLQDLINGLRDEVARIKVDGVARTLGQEAIDAQVEAAVDRFREKLLEIAAVARENGVQIPGLFSLISDALGDTATAAEETAKTIDLAAQRTASLVSALRNLSQFGRTFGFLSQGVAGFVDGLANAVQAANDLKEVREKLAAAQAAGQTVGAGASTLAQLGPLVGVVGAVAGSVLALGNQLRDNVIKRQEESRAQVEAMKRLEASLRDAAKGFTQAVDELLGSIVGSDVSGAQARAAQEIVSQFGSLIRLAESGGGPRGTGRGSGQDSLAEEGARKLIRQLEDTGIQAFEGLEGLFDNLIQFFGPGQVEDAIRALLTGLDTGAGGFSFPGLDEIVAELVNNLGGIADSVEGVLESFDIFSRFLELDAQQGFDAFVRNLLALGEDVLGADLVGELTKFFEGADLSDENTRGFLNQIIRDILLEVTGGGSGLLSNISQDQLLEILETLQGFIEDGGAGGAGALGGSDPEALSRSVVLGSSITEFQANQLIALNQDAEYTRRAILDQMVQLNANFSGPGRMFFGSSGEAGPTYNFDFSGARIQPDLTETQIREISVRIAQTIRARSFSGSGSTTTRF